MKHALFICEKFCDANPSIGWTNSFHNLINTFEATQNNWIVNTLHLDEAKIIYDRSIDEAIAHYSDNFKIDVVFLSLLGMSPLNPSLDSLKLLKNLGKKICVIWPDTDPIWAINIMALIKDYVDLHVCLDFPSGEHISNKLIPENHILTWTPQDESLYNNQLEKDIDFSFLGSKDKIRYNNRHSFLELLKFDFGNNSYKMSIGGGQREESLSKYQYANIVKRSKIGINFSLHSRIGFHQVKGRVSEYLSCESLLLESENEATKKLLVPNVDYVEFQEYSDLKEKIIYYLKNEDERLKISKNGYKKYKTFYNNTIFWNSILEKLQI